MRTVLTVSTVLGVVGVVAAFGLFYLSERVFHLDRAHTQTLMYLKLSVAGHLTIFLTRTRGPFWSIRPANILWIAVLSTQAVATLVAVYGAYIMTPLGWSWAAFVWGYALAWFLVNDRLKLLTYRYLDSTTKAVKTPQNEPATDDAKPTSTKPLDAEAAPAKAEDEKRARAKTEDVATAAVAAPDVTPVGEDAHANASPLLGVKLGDLLAAGKPGELRGAGRLIAQAISEIEKKSATATTPPATPRAAE